MECLHVVVTFYSIANEAKKKASIYTPFIHVQENQNEKKKFKSPNRLCSCVYERAYGYVFSGWFVEPHLRAVCLWKIERWLVVGASSSFFSLLRMPHYKQFSMLIIPVAFGALVVAFCFAFDYMPDHSNNMWKYRSWKVVIVWKSLAPLHQPFINRTLRRLSPIKGLIEFYCLRVGRFCEAKSFRNHVLSEWDNQAEQHLGAFLFLLLVVADENVQLARRNFSFCAVSTRIENFMLMIAPATRIIPLTTLYRASVSIPPFQAYVSFPTSSMAATVCRTSACY